MNHYDDYPTMCDFHGVAIVTSAHGQNYCPKCEAETTRAELWAESAWERAAENRYDPDAEADLALHNELWPNGYGYHPDHPRDCTINDWHMDGSTVVLGQCNCISA